MSTDSDREAILRTIADTLRSFDAVRMGYVFGSFLLGSDFQDIHVAVLLVGGFSPGEELKYSRAIGRAPDQGPPRLQGYIGLAG